MLGNAYDKDMLTDEEYIDIFGHPRQRRRTEEEKKRKKFKDKFLNLNEGEKEELIKQLLTFE